MALAMASEWAGIREQALAPTSILVSVSVAGRPCGRRTMSNEQDFLWQT